MSYPITYAFNALTKKLVIFTCYKRKAKRNKKKQPPSAAAFATSSPSPNWVIRGPSSRDRRAALND